jgi:hypothetical protein
MNDRPLQRREDLVTTGTGDDLIVYDATTHALHTLNPRMAEVFRRCDGTATIDDLVRDPGLDEHTVLLAIELLGKAGLLDGDSLTGLPTLTSRRGFLRKAGIAIGVPAIASVTMPMASAAQSVTCTPSGGPCSLNNPGACCSFTCTNFTPPNPPVCA